MTPGFTPTPVSFLRLNILWPAPVGYDPAIIPAWEKPTSDAFAALKLEPWRLRVFPGTALLSGGTVGEVLVWQG